MDTNLQKRIKKVNQSPKYAKKVIEGYIIQPLKTELSIGRRNGKEWRIVTLAAIQSIIKKYEYARQNLILKNRQIKQLRKEIERLREEQEKKDQKITKYKNMYEAEYDIHKVRNEQLDRKEKGIEKAKQQLIEKDEKIKSLVKQIDLMARQLIGLPIDKIKQDFEKPNFKEEIKIFTDKEDIKQYFKNKTEQ